MYRPFAHGAKPSDECYDSPLPKLFKELLRDAIHLKKKLTPFDYLSPSSERDDLVRRLTELIEKPINPTIKNLQLSAEG